MEQVETRALKISQWGNLGMALAGIVAAWASNSQSLMMDGLFSGVGFLSAIAAIRIARNASRGPDRDRPFGYAADEAIYKTFRSLALLGLVMFGLTNAVLNILRYASGGEPPALEFGPIVVYAVAVSIVCFGLAWTHRRAWIRTGRKSGMLKLEMHAALYDGAVTVVAGVALLAAPFLTKTALAPIVPVADSVVLLFLCGFAITGYFVTFRGGLAELAGATAHPDDILSVSRVVRPLLKEVGARLIDLAMIRTGRTDQIVLYISPGQAMTGGEIDALTKRLQAALLVADREAAILVVLSEQGRTGPTNEAET
ncbi:MAG: cation transporter [Paracoccaceae bacterium]